MQLGYVWVWIIQFKQNPKYKGYRTAASFVMVERAKLLPLSKLNSSAQLVYELLHEPTDIDCFLARIADKLNTPSNEISADVRDCLEGLCKADYVLELGDWAAQPSLLARVAGN